MVFAVFCAFLLKEEPQKQIDMLKKDIGIDAGTIWRHLSEKGILSVRQIGELTNYRDGLILMALGWLARENKIYFLEKNDALYVELVSSSPEMYY